VSNVEIERKFLVKDIAMATRDAPYVDIQQGYLAVDKDNNTVRVRTEARNKGIITIKGKTEGISRPEFEYEISFMDAVKLMEICIGHPVTKTRYKVIDDDDQRWDVDAFHDGNVGLFVAEIELDYPDQSIYFPKWLGREVSADERYYNAYLSQHPYSTWKQT
jgi:adenylate cyclase